MSKKEQRENFPVDEKSLTRLIAKAEIVDNLINAGILPPTVPTEKSVAESIKAEVNSEEPNLDVHKLAEDMLKVFSPDELYFMIKIQLARRHPGENLVLSPKEVDMLDGLLHKNDSVHDELLRCRNIMSFIEDLLVRDHMRRNEQRLAAIKPMQEEDNK